MEVEDGSLNLNVKNKKILKIMIGLVLNFK